MAVYFKKELFNQLLQFSQQKMPEEACGLILGKSTSPKEELLASSFVPMRNCSTKPRIHFELDPAEMIPYLTNSQNPVIGLFHSHPTASAVPSAADLQTLWHTIPTHWILSLANPDNPELMVYQIKKASLTSYHKLAFVIGQ
ncbi:M67 family metallopeptidase [Paenibacillus sp. MAH-36]|uniref:M67 family metallopeptidase n=1 Tax=Paenibacillus violae TaxID=3077234 RepID=A0ABU3RJ13_9BACL|nr:M67 family metallopeptidase [Paenibacillus sp. PFR10]MDU0204123.1 M67 family metallopeptidase [Paenibacillus sp. PFR10]